MNSLTFRRTDSFAWEGLCNRINLMVTALTLNKPCRLYWAVNHHCPARFEQLFKPVEQLSVFNVNADCFPYSKRADSLCWFYLENFSELDRYTYVQRAKGQYRRLISHLIHRATIDLPPDTAGLAFRTHLPAGSADDLDEFLRKVPYWLTARRAKSVFIVSDSRESKERLTTFVERLGIKATVIDCPLMDHDFDRSCENLYGLSKELVCLSQCHCGILSNSFRSTVCDSARGFDIHIDYTFDSRNDRRNYLIEGWMNEPVY